MDHVAIFSSSTKFLQKILMGQKTIESRWLAQRRAPYNKVSVGDTMYLKNSGKPITAKVQVKSVEEFDELTPTKIMELLKKHHSALGLDDIDAFFNQVKFKKYATLITLDTPEMIIPKELDKSGFGNQAAWIVVEDITSITK